MVLPRLRHFRRLLPWPLPALCAWALAWALFVLARRLGLGVPTALALAGSAAVLAALLAPNWWRRLAVAAGFPLSLLLLTPGLAGSLPAWVWLVPLALLLLLYPVKAWRDAPLFPTPVAALDALPAHAALAAGARVLDAGCGLGHGLRALRRAYPQAQLDGLEWSWPLALLCALRCPWARVRRGDIWQADWSGYALVYLFQRPESMERALRKAAAELRPGAWLVSLEFAAPGWHCHVRLGDADGKMLWLYRAPLHPV